MEDLKKLLEEKRTMLFDLQMEIIDIEGRIIQDMWKDKPVCQHEFSEISKGKCLHAQTRRCQVYCYHPNCHK